MRATEGSLWTSHTYTTITARLTTIGTCKDLRFLGHKKSLKKTNSRRNRLFFPPPYSPLSRIGGRSYSSSSAPPLALDGRQSPASNTDSPPNVTLESQFNVFEPKRRRTRKRLSSCPLNYLPQPRSCFLHQLQATTVADRILPPKLFLQSSRLWSTPPLSWATGSGHHRSTR